MALTLIGSAHTPASGAIAITSNIDSTYRGYEFHIYNCHPSDGIHPSGYLAFQCNQTTITSSAFNALSDEGEGTSNQYFSYRGAQDQAQTTNYQMISMAVGDGTNQAVSGVLKLYDPAAAFPTQFISRTSSAWQSGSDLYCEDMRVSGYINSTTAVTSVTFKFVNSSASITGTIDAGTIKVFGVS